VTAPPDETLTEATFSLLPGQTYVRVACHDIHGRWAWTNPILLQVLDYSRDL